MAELINDVLASAPILANSLPMGDEQKQAEMAWTAEQELAAWQSIEQCEEKIVRLFHDFGFSSAEYVTLGKQLVNGEASFNRYVLPENADERQSYLSGLAELIQKLEYADGETGAAYARFLISRDNPLEAVDAEAEFLRCRQTGLQLLPSFRLTRRAELGLTTSIGVHYNEAVELAKSDASSDFDDRRMGIEQTVRMAPGKFIENCQMIEELRSKIQQARSEITRGNISVVREQVQRYSGRGIDPESLIESGLTGLYRAAFLFDYRMGSAFSSYALWWVRGAIATELAARLKAKRRESR